MLPIADQVRRAVAAPFQPGLNAEMAHLLTDGDIVVDAIDGGEGGAAAFGRRLSAASHPLRLDIVFDPRRAGGTLLVASEALSRGLGPRCLPNAIEPLVRGEAAGGDRTYLASLGVEVVQAAYEADRFGKPMLPLWLFPEVAILCSVLAGLSHRLGRMTAPVASYAPSSALTEDRRKLDAKLARIDDETATTRASLAERHAVAAAAEPTWWRRLNVLRRFGERREAARARARTAVLTEKLENLQKTRTAVETEISKNDPKLLDKRRRFDARVEDKAWLTKFSGRVVGVLAITVAVLAAAHATTAAVHPSALISASRSDPILLRGDTLIATALEANPDLVEAVAAHCDARVVQPEPQEATAADAADRSPGEPAIAGPPHSPEPPFGGLQHCFVGIPCGRACIPAERVCHIGQVVHVG